MRKKLYEDEKTAVLEEACACSYNAASPGYDKTTTKRRYQWE